MEPSHEGPASRRPALGGTLAFLLGWILVILAALLATGWLLARYATGNDVGEADAAVAHWFVTERTPTLDDVSKYTSMVSDTLVVIVLAALAVVVMRMAFRRWREGMLIIAALVGEVVLFLSSAALVDRDRPAVPQLDDAPPTSSFPSGHVAAAVCLYGALALIARSRMRPGALRRLVIAALVALPLAVATARMYRGMHYLTDVLTGLAFGWAWLTVSARGVSRRVPDDPARTGGASRSAERSQGRRL